MSVEFGEMERTHSTHNVVLISVANGNVYIFFNGKHTQCQTLYEARGYSHSRGTCLFVCVILMGFNGLKVTILRSSHLIRVAMRAGSKQ